MTPSRLHINQLSFRYRRSAILNAVDFDLSTNQVIGLLGRNGAGKSTLMQCIAGILKTKHIQTYIDDVPVDVTAHQQQLISYLPQDPFLMKGLKVIDAVQAMYEDPSDQDVILYEPMVHQMHDKKVGALSMGERRFLEFLVIFNLPHPFVMLDEPFSGLAPLQIQRVQEIINAKKGSKGILISDHYYHNVLQITDVNLLLTNGKLQSIAADQVAQAYRNG